VQEQQQLTNTLEALIFASPQPLSRLHLRQILTRLHGEAEAAETALAGLDEAINLLRQRWQSRSGGFELIDVAEGLAFRSAAEFGDALRAMREQKPQRLSRPALETLAIVAYRQPATKPEIDHIRGVDCGGTLKLLLERELIRIVGKKEEPGRPLCYGTTKDFLNLFSLPSLQGLPSLRDFVELNEQSEEELSDKFGPSLQELSATVTQLRPVDAEPAINALQDAVSGLDSTETQARQKFAEQGLVLPGDPEPETELAAAKKAAP
jgi:segregation and condensation protein B